MVAGTSPIIGHLALALGQRYGVALGLAAAQAVACGVVLWTSLPARRWLGPVVSAALLLALELGVLHSPAAGLLAVAGVGHALLYTGLFLLVAASLRPGRTALVTTIASRVNPNFHSGMVPYTRGVTWAWLLFFAGQLVASAALLAFDPALWRALVTTLHLPLVLVMALAEVLVRRWRFRHDQPTGFIDTVRGIRRLLQQTQRAANSPTAR